MIKLCLILIIFSLNSFAFIKIHNNRFEKNGRPYLFMGTNFWQGMNLGSANKELVGRELDRMKNFGINQLRILALTEGSDFESYRIIPAVQKKPGEFDEKILQGLDFLLVEMNKREMSAVVCLTNFWHWSGGMAQWMSWSEATPIPYPPPHPGGSWSVFQEYSARFYSNVEAQNNFKEAIKKIISRTNTISQKKYVDDPTIMSWQLANEPRGDKNREPFLKWISSTAKLIKSLDPNHLVSLGSEGDTLSPQTAGNDFIEDHQISEIDYTTIHIWLENWGVYNPTQSSLSLKNSLNIMKNYIQTHIKKSLFLKKPLVIEEFGLARDQRSMDPSSTTIDRNTMYKALFEEVLVDMKKENSVISGVNFWAWSGESLPRKPYGHLWKVGDSFLGDPPHEEQGWYGVYSTDESTLDIIKDYSFKFSKLSSY